MKKQNYGIIKNLFNKFRGKLTPSISDDLFYVSPHLEGYISPETICEENSVEQLCEKAEKYFQKVTDPLPFISRPFANFSKSPDSLISLGGIDFRSKTWKDYESFGICFRRLLVITITEPNGRFNYFCGLFNICHKNR